MNDAVFANPGALAEELRVSPDGVRAWGSLTVFLVCFFFVDFFLLYKNPLHSQNSFLFLFWVFVDILTGFIIFRVYGGNAAGNYADGFFLEGLFSIDNLALFFFVFQAYGTPPELCGKILSYGMVLACPLRLLFYYLELGALRVTWVIVATGVLLILSGLWALGTTAATAAESYEWNAQKRPLFRWLLKTGRLWPYYDYQGRFFVKAAPMQRYPSTTDALVNSESGAAAFAFGLEGKPLQDGAVRQGRPRWQLTLMPLTLLTIEAVDVLFTADSTIANVAISSNVFVCYVSSIFALFTMRSLFASIASLLDSLWLMRYVLAILLVAVGVKVVSEPWIDIPQDKFLCWLGMYMLAGVLMSVAFYSVSTSSRTRPVEFPSRSPLGSTGPRRLEAEGDAAEGDSANGV